MDGENTSDLNPRSTSKPVMPEALMGKRAVLGLIDMALAYSEGSHPPRSRHSLL